MTIRSPVPALLAVLLATACVTDPVTGSATFSLSDWSLDEELALGRREAPGIESQFDAVYPDAEAQRVLGEILDEMVALSPRRDDFAFRPKILNSSVPNALALPGGFVYVTRGLLGMVTTEAQLVSVLGHELGHVEHRHAMLASSRGELLRLPTLPLDALRRTLPVGKGVVGAASSIVGAPAALTALRYSRKHELQADERGVFFAAELGFDPRDFRNVLARFEELEQRGAKGFPGDLWVFRTHPHNGQRMAALEQTVRRRYPELADRPPGSFASSSPAFEELRAGLREKAVAYEHHDEARRLLQEEEDPTAPEVVAVALEHVESARALLPEEPLFAILEGEVALLAGDGDRSVRAFLEAVQLYDRLTPGDGHWKAHLYLGLFALEAKRTAIAVAELERAAELFPGNPLVHATLADAYERDGQPQKAEAARERRRALLAG